MNSAEKAKRLLIIGFAGCLLYVLGDFLYAATGKGQTTEAIGLFTMVAYLDMAEWRMWASIFCGFAGTVLYYMGFNQMYGLLKLRVTEPKNGVWVRLFHVAYIMGTVAWTWVHAMFMIDALVFKFVYAQYGDMQAAADIANRVLYANAPGMLIAYILCDFGLTVTMIAMVWKRIIPLKSTAARILATLCNPLMLAGVVGNLVGLLPWPINQLDHGTESFGHALVLLLGLILLREMVKNKELPA